LTETLLVGRITKAHGLRGDVVVDLLSSEESRLAPGATLDSARGPLVVAASRPHQGKWIVVFDGVNSREAADALRGVELTGEPIDDPEALWVHELIGVAVREVDGTERGTITAVFPNPADDLLELDGAALVPVTFIVGFEGEGDDRRLVIDPPDGLFDI
jgi:16S rRNA processing protein RimM